jgi:hypothetical protein
MIIIQLQIENVMIIPLWNVKYVIKWLSLDKIIKQIQIKRWLSMINVLIVMVVIRK